MALKSSELDRNTPIIGDDLLTLTHRRNRIRPIFTLFAGELTSVLMSRLILIDNWLESLGGHNYQYAVEILNAARDSGLEVALATAKSFEKSTGSISMNGLAIPSFRTRGIEHTPLESMENVKSPLMLMDFRCLKAATRTNHLRESGTDGYAP